MAPVADPEDQRDTMLHFYLLTRMHSSRMCTSRFSTVTMGLPDNDPLSTETPWTVTPLDLDLLCTENPTQKPLL